MPRAPSAEARDIMADQFESDGAASRELAQRIREGTFSNYWLDRGMRAIDAALDMDREYARG